MTRDEELADRLVQLTVVVLAIKAVGLLLLAGSAAFRPVPGGTVPVKSATTQEMSSTTTAAIATKASTMRCGISMIGRKKQVSRFLPSKAGVMSSRTG